MSRDKDLKRLAKIRSWDIWDVLDKTYIGPTAGNLDPDWSSAPVPPPNAPLSEHLSFISWVLAGTNYAKVQICLGPFGGSVWIKENNTMHIGEAADLTHACIKALLEVSRGHR